MHHTARTLAGTGSEPCKIGTPHSQAPATLAGRLAAHAQPPSNAIEFTPAEDTITLRRAPRAEGGVIISVADRGHGIARDKQAWIFEPFVQVDRRCKREQEGIDIGLAISRGTSGVNGVTSRATVSCNTSYAAFDARVLEGSTHERSAIPTNPGAALSQTVHPRHAVG
jgi:light-regulated signal transduction histidine kinase (bacteriophytochrome)